MNLRARKTICPLLTCGSQHRQIQNPPARDCEPSLAQNACVPIGTNGGASVTLPLVVWHIRMRFPGSPKALLRLRF